jgi:8-oxo-dGTP pyrophosphatase MutT (NUDIX family)
MFQGFFEWIRRGIQRPLGTPFAFEVSAGAVVFRVLADGTREYLLLQYSYGYWDFVKGHCENQETLVETMARELQEETGLTVRRQMKGFHWKSRYWYIAKGRERERRLAEGKGIWIAKTVHFFLIEAGAGDVRISHEHIGSKWFRYPIVLEALIFERSKEIIRAAEKLLCL